MVQGSKFTTSLIGNKKNMALSLPTSSNTTGEFSNSVVAANLTSTAFTRDSKFGFANAQNEMTGVSIAISANGDYAVVGNRAANPQGTKKGFPFIIARSGNTWSTQASLVVQTAANTITNSEDNYSGWNDNPWNKNVSIDNSGTTVAIAGSNQPPAYDGKGRVEIWERSGSTWSFTAGFDGNTQDSIGYNGVVLSGDGTSLLAGGTDTIARYIKSGGSWTQDFLVDTDPNIGLGYPLDYSKDGTKYVHLNKHHLGNNTSIAEVKLNTSYYNGSTWANTVQIIDQSGYHSTRAKNIKMSGDGNYLSVYFQDNTSSDGHGRIHIFVWDSANNDWDSQAVVSGKPANGWGASPTLNNDGTKLIAGGNGANPWIAYKRTGSTWTKESENNWPGFIQGVGNMMTGNGLTALSDDGLHLLLSAPQAYWTNSGYGNGDHQRGMVEYWVPTGVGVSSISDGQVAIHNGRRFRFNSAKSRWTPANKTSLDNISSTIKKARGIVNTSLSSGNELNIDGVTVSVDDFAGRTETYANASIFPFSNLQSGDQAIALDTGYLYVTDGSGWFKVANSQPV